MSESLLVSILPRAMRTCLTCLGTYNFIEALLNHHSRATRTRKLSNWAHALCIMPESPLVSILPRAMCTCLACVGTYNFIEAPLNHHSRYTIDLKEGIKAITICLVTALPLKCGFCFFFELLPVVKLEGLVNVSIKSFVFQPFCLSKVGNYLICTLPNGISENGGCLLVKSWKLPDLHSSKWNIWKRRTSFGA
jgi:hypothetical protein